MRAGTRGKTGSLVAVGTGYMVCARITTEAAEEIANADSVFYVVYDWMDEVWLRRIKPDAISLAALFDGRYTDNQACDMTVETVMRAVRKGDKTCLAFSGHPSVCVAPTQMAFHRARKEGFPVRMVPGVSALDCLFADLCLDPMTVSCRVFDTTRFLLEHHRIDSLSGLVLLQPSRIGQSASKRRKDIVEPNALELLEDVLIKTYGVTHNVIHYQAALSPLADSIVDEIPISSLHTCDLKFKSTLYVPPAS